jgi:hypothetical protein
LTAAVSGTPNWLSQVVGGVEKLLLDLSAPAIMVEGRVAGARAARG